MVGLLRKICAGYKFEPVAVFKRSGDHPWPLVAKDEADLEAQLLGGGHFLPLPKEPAALANVVEVGVVDFLLSKLDPATCETVRGTERGYPDLELKINGKFFAVDVKVAQRRIGKKGPTGQTKSRITLYTGNTFFAYPTLHWPGTFRPFGDYAGHIDIIAIYRLDVDSPSRVCDIELIVTEPWKIASKQRSSMTREYIGAVMSIDALKNGKGDFATPEEFYKYWRSYKFKIGDAVKRQLQKLLGKV